MIALFSLSVTYNLHSLFGKIAPHHAKRINFAEL